MNDEEIERKIAYEVVKNLLNAGYLVKVFDGEEIALKATNDKKAIIGNMSNMGEDHLIVVEPITRKEIGWVRLIYGNGADIISDYTVNLEDVLVEANTLAEKLHIEMP